MSIPVNHLTFGIFSIDLRQRILLREGKHFPLTPKAFDILLVLIENRDRIVSKEELMAKVWPDTTVEEINIAKNISLLRKALANGDNRMESDDSSSDAGEYIVTISKRGYRFVYPVQEVSANTPLIIRQSPAPPVSESPQQIEQKKPASDSVSEPPAFVQPFPSVSKSSISRGWFYLAGIAGALIGIAVWLSLQKEAEADDFDLSRLKTSLVTNWKGGAGSDFGVKVSPDGKMIAFSKSDNGQEDIYVLQLTGNNLVPVVTDKWPNYSPIWSPDGQKLAHLSRHSAGNEVWVTPSLGGKGDKVLALDGDYTRLLRWSKDGTRIFYNTRTDLFVLDLNSGKTSKLTNFGAANPIRQYFSLSPDEKSISYAEKVNDSLHIFTMRLDGGSPVQVTNEGEQNVYPVWFADSKRILYGSKRGNALQLCVADPDRRKPVQLTAGHGSAFPFHVSPDGRKIFYLASKEEADVYRLDLTTNIETPITSEALLEVWSEVSPDGKGIAFQRTDDEFNILRSSILTKTLGAGNAATELISNGFDLRWSPRSERLAFLRAEGNAYNLWTVGLDGSDQRQLTKSGIIPNGFSSRPYNWSQPNNYSWSPDGSRLAFCGMPQPAINIWTVASEGEEERKISNNTDPKTRLSCPMWSADGKRLMSLAQTSLGGQSIQRIEMHEDGQTQILFQTDSRVRMIGWSVDGTHFFAGLAEPAEQGPLVTLNLMTIAIGRPTEKPIAQLPLVYFNSPRLSPDGKALVFASRRNGSDNVWLMSLTDRHLRMITTNTDPNMHFSSLAWLPDGKSIFFSRQTNSIAIWSIEDFN